jgi:hypothetical protein
MFPHYFKLNLAEDYAWGWEARYKPRELGAAGCWVLFVWYWLLTIDFLSFVSFGVS